MRFNLLDFFLKKRVIIETHKEEKIRAEINKGFKALGDMLPEKMCYDKHLIRPYYVSFDIPGTKNEAILHIDGMNDSEVIFRLDVLRKGTQQVYSHYLKSCPHSRVISYVFVTNDRDDVYNSVIGLSRKVDEYWDTH